MISVNEQWKLIRAGKWSLRSDRLKMMGALLSRLLVMAFGYVYPAYECYKTLEKEETDIHQLVFWCQYWILVALVTVFERVGDVFVSWIPLYHEAKFTLFIYLWHPRTRGAIYAYNSFIKPYIAKHQKEIDCTLLYMKNEAVKMAILLWQKASQYGQTKIFEILQYASSSSRLQPAEDVRPKAK